MMTETLRRRLEQAKFLWLFLDYDGTLADFAPTPDHIVPDPELIALLDQLSQHPHTHLAIVSGRRLAHLEKLVPLPNIILAGTYGLELRMSDGRRIERVPYPSIRPALEHIRPMWEKLIGPLKGYYLEDKGWSLALHARDADELEALRVLTQACEMAEATNLPETIKFLGGHKFLEVCPRLADKGETVRYLLEQTNKKESLLVYLGDDDKDESAFCVVQEYNGIAGLVSLQEKNTQADFRLDSPRFARIWLAEILNLKIEDAE
ncbi:MAG TPA: trehalose-phosphatase [Anaerolineales bacterium]|nr:trehalose-phosphatase [Anaerolineales bacterium]